MTFILLIAAGNLVLGFVLAVHLGHGPHWIDLTSPGRLLNGLRSALRRQKKPA